MVFLEPFCPRVHDEIAEFSQAKIRTITNLPSRSPTEFNLGLVSQLLLKQLETVAFTLRLALGQSL